MPLISVIIPTRQRPHLLKSALRSVMEQKGFSDYEVIVSDNSPDKSAAPVVAPYADDPRVRYVNTGEDLDAYESWSFAYEQAQGEYTFLYADDDCILPRGLATMARALRRYDYPDFLGLASCWYSHRSRQAPPQNALRFDVNWSEEGLRDPRQMLEAFFGFYRPTFSPTYVLVGRRVREKLAARGVSPYTRLFPDYSMQACALAMAETAAVMSEPTVIHGYAAESMGEQALGARRKEDWASVIGRDDLFEYSPLKGYYFINGWLETLLRVQAALPDELGGLTIGWSVFLERFLTELFNAGQWVDIREDARYFLDFINSLSPEVRAPILARLRTPINCLLRLLEARAWDKMGGVGGEEWLQGEDHEFDDILGAAQAASRLYRARRRRDNLMASILNPPSLEAPGGVLSSSGPESMDGPNL